MLEHIEREGLAFLAAPELLDAGVLVAFTGCEGGVSAGPFSSLNISYNVGDERLAVAENRRRVAEAIGTPVDRWVLCRQVHGRAVARVSRLEIGRGAWDHESGMPRTDGLVTDLPGVAIAVLTADCLPIVMTATGPAVAVVHAGWRGVLAGIPAAGAARLAARTDCSSAEMSVFIGPHIKACCMEAGPEVVEKFRRRFGDSVIEATGVSGAKIDLEAACRLQLESAGISAAQTFGAGWCTSCGDGLFSYRRSGGVCGRQGGFAAILE